MRISLLVIALAGCKSKTAEPPAAAKGPTLAVSIAGKPVTVKEAYVKGLPIEGAFA